MWLYVVSIKPKLGGNFTHVYVNPKERHGVYFSQVAAFLSLYSPSYISISPLYSETR